MAVALSVFLFLLLCRTAEGFAIESSHDAELPAGSLHLKDRQVTSRRFLLSLF